jgi:hypothetical protein
MTRRLPLLILCLFTLTACATVSQSRLNPFNWFKRSEAGAGVQVAAKPTDPRPLVQSVLDMKVEPYPGGAIVRATGLPPTQGWYKADLVALPVDENGVLVLEFRVTPPPAQTGAVNQQSREIVVAYSVPDVRLEKITKIVVQGETNSRTSGR